MAKAREVLLDAAYSYSDNGEHRLTELFATVLTAHSELANALFKRVGLTRGVRYEVATQQRFGVRVRPDLVVRSLQRRGALVSQLWCEHRTWSEFRPEQREDYLAALRGEPGEKALLCLTLEPPGDEPPSGWHAMTWQGPATCAATARAPWAISSERARRWTARRSSSRAGRARRSRRSPRWTRASSPCPSPTGPRRAVERTSTDR